MPSESISLDDYDYDIPDELIAQHPSPQRDESRLFVLRRDEGIHEHLVFREITKILRSGDILVFNNARVFNARIFCTRGSGAKIELLLTERKTDMKWSALCNRKKRLRVGEIIHALEDPEITFTIEDKGEDSICLKSSVPLTPDILDRLGKIPLPPYIRRQSYSEDASRYQTVFATVPGSAAAPTAGLHFTEKLLSEIDRIGVRRAFLTLNVSWGTFMPVRENNIIEDRLHRETYHLPELSAEILNEGRKGGGRIIAVGTTALRVLETTYINGENVPGHGATDLFIHPPRKILSVQGLITNFHTPRSSLLMLVSAFAGRDRIMSAYKTAIELKYRFFSYGDAMFIIE